MILDLFAGPAGWDMGARILGVGTPIHGYDIDADACATARAAGFLRIQADVAALDPEVFSDVTTVVISSPCPTLSASGKRTGTSADDRRIIMGGIRAIADPGDGDPDEYHQAYECVTDPRTALLLENIRFGMHLPDVMCLIAEQVPGAHDYWTETAAEMATARDFESCYVLVVHGEDLGLASNRKRVFLIATRDWTPDLGRLPIRSGWHCGRFEPPHLLMPTDPLFAATTMAGALGWPAGERVNTRGARKTSGGNEFSADGPAWCLTEKARSWRRVSDGEQLTAAQAGLLTGFPADYPWQGSRSKQFLQAADVVSPPVAAAILGTALCLDWEQPVRDYLAELYPASVGAPQAVQPSLFAEVA